MFAFITSPKIRNFYETTASNIEYTKILKLLILLFYIDYIARYCTNNPAFTRQGSQVRTLWCPPKIPRFFKRLQHQPQAIAHQKVVNSKLNYFS
jgi:hypothetical protein